MKTPALSALLIALCLSPTLASAQVSDVDVSTARTLAQEGHAAFDSRDWATAADRFARAEALHHAPTLLLGLAQSQVALGKLASAAEAYDRILRDPLPPNAPPAFVGAVEAARRELEALGPRIPYVIIQVKGAAAVDVTLDGVEVPSAALGVKRAVDPGAHAIRAVRAGFAPVEAALTSVEGRTETVTLEPKAAAAPLTGPEPAVAGGAPPPPVPPLAVVPSSQPSPSFARRHRGSLVLAGVGAGLAAAGGVLAGVALSDAGSASAMCVRGMPCPGIDGVRTKVIAADVMFGAAGAAVVTAVLVFAIGERRASATGWLSPSSAGVGVRF